MRKHFSLAVTLFYFLLVLSCTDNGVDNTTEEEYEHNFTNYSSHEVTVSPSYPDIDDFESFTIGYLEAHTITDDDAVLLFDFVPGEYVYLQDNSGLNYGLFSFLDRTVIFLTNNSSTDLIFVMWNQSLLYYFGNDEIWASSISDYVTGLASGSSDYQAIDPSVGHIYFSYPDILQEYRVSFEYDMWEGRQLDFSFTDDTPVEIAP